LPWDALHLPFSTTADLCLPGKAMHKRQREIFTKYDIFVCHKNTLIPTTLPQYQLKQLSTAQLSVVPEGLRDYVKMLLNIKPELRPDAHQFTQVC
jgi:hypothetical protein